MLKTLNSPLVPAPRTPSALPLIIGLIGMLLALLAFTQTPATKQTQTATTFALSATGALTLNLNQAEISCSRQALNFTVNPSSLAGYSLNFTSLSQLQELEQTSILSLNSTNRLSFDLIDENQNSYRSFTATQGELKLDHNTGILSANLQDSSSEQLFINAQWTCPKA